MRTSEVVVSGEDSEVINDLSIFETITRAARLNGGVKESHEGIEVLLASNPELGRGGWGRGRERRECGDSGWCARMVVGRVVAKPAFRDQGDAGGACWEEWLVQWRRHPTRSARWSRENHGGFVIALKDLTANPVDRREEPTEPLLLALTKRRTDGTDVGVVDFIQKSRLQSRGRDRGRVAVGPLAPFRVSATAVPADNREARKRHLLFAARRVELRRPNRHDESLVSGVEEAGRHDIVANLRVAKLTVKAGGVPQPVRQFVKHHESERRDGPLGQNERVAIELYESTD
jgi:hypothetical protein